VLQLFNKRDKERENIIYNIIFYVHKTHMYVHTCILLLIPLTEDKIFSENAFTHTHTHIYIYCYIKLQVFP